MSTRPRRSTLGPTQNRARYARFGANDMTVNSPAGYPSAYPPITWLGTGGDGPTDWWWGSDSPSGPLGPGGPFPGGGRDHSVVTRATSLIVGPLSASPYKVVSEGSIGMPLPVPTWVRDPMLLRPDARVVDTIYPSVLRLSRSGFWSGFVRNALHFGLGAFLFIPDEAGAPLAGSLRLVDPRFLSTERDDGGALCWSIDDGEGSPAVFERDGSISFGTVTYKLVVLRNPLSSVDAEGMSLGVFAMHPATFKLGMSIQNFMNGVFKTGVPSGVLKVDQPILTQEQSDELKTKWAAAHGSGSSGGRSVAVLNATTSYTPISYSPETVAIGESVRIGISSCAFAFGLDPDVLGAGLSNSSTYRNATEFWQRHRDFSLSPWLSGLQDVLSALLPGSQGVVVALDSFANPPLAERVATGAAAVSAGLMSADEWRAAEGLPPLPPQTPEPVLSPSPAPVPQPEPEPAPDPEPERSLRAVKPAWRR